MTKAELITAVAEKSGLSKKDSEKAVGAVVDAITDALKAGEKVALVGFGTFETKTRNERKGINLSLIHISMKKGGDSFRISAFLIALAGLPPGGREGMPGPAPAGGPISCPPKK